MAEGGDGENEEVKRREMDLVHKILVEIRQPVEHNDSLSRKQANTKDISTVPSAHLQTKHSSHYAASARALSLSLLYISKVIYKVKFHSSFNPKPSSGRLLAAEYPPSSRLLPEGHPYRAESICFWKYRQAAVSLCISRSQ